MVDNRDFNIDCGHARAGSGHYGPAGWHDESGDGKRGLDFIVRDDDADGL